MPTIGKDIAFLLSLKRMPRFVLQRPSSAGQKQDPVGARIESNPQETDLIEAEFETRAGRDAVSCRIGVTANPQNLSSATHLMSSVQRLVSTAWARASVMRSPADSDAGDLSGNPTIGPEPVADSIRTLQIANASQKTG
jgi:hypothetical protein